MSDDVILDTYSDLYGNTRLDVDSALFGVDVQNFHNCNNIEPPAKIYKYVRDYDYNIYKVEKFADGVNVPKYKLTKMNCCSVAGSQRTEEVNIKDMTIEEYLAYRDYIEKGSVNDEKLPQNISRARNKILEYGYCNQWDLFCTFTLSPEKYNREDLKQFNKDFSRYIRNFNQYHNLNIKFLLVPELHKDNKSWHMHGLFSGLPVSYLTKFKIGDKMSSKLASFVRQGRDMYDWVSYSSKFGYCALEAIHSKDQCIKYLIKYVTKNMVSCVKEVNAHIYYCSKGLNLSECVRKNYADTLQNIKYDFENDYCAVKWLSAAEFKNLFD